MKWRQWKKRCILACIGGLLWGGAAGLNVVNAYDGELIIGYQANGGRASYRYDMRLYVDEDGNHEMDDTTSYAYSSGAYTGNVAIGNYSEASAEPNYEEQSIQVYEETLDPSWDREYNGKKYNSAGYIQLIKKGNDYYQHTGVDGEGRDVYAKYNFDTRATEPGTEKTGEELGFRSLATNTVAVGNHARTRSHSSVAVGHDSHSQGYRSIAIGAESQSGDTTDAADYNDGISAIAIGDQAKAMGNGSVATGQGAQANGYASIASGVYAGAHTIRSIAIGEQANVHYIADAGNDPQRLVAEQAIAIGAYSQANGKDATAVGRQAVADRRNSTAYGNNSHANGYNSVAVGNKAIAGLKTETDQDSIAGQSAVAVGNRATATKEYTTAVGASTFADGWHSVAVGDSNHATGRFSTAMGAGWSNYTVDENDNDNKEKERNYQDIGANQATGDYSTSVGYGNATLGQGSSAFGMQNAVSGENSVGIGGQNIIGSESNPGDTSVINKQNAGDITGFAFGHKNKVTGQRGLAGGESAQVTAEDSIAFGTEAQATLARSVALGSGAKTNEVVGTSVVEIPGTGQTYSNISGTNPVGTVSVGDKGKERTITNVAAGRIGPGSTDAVNGSELYAVYKQAGINAQNITNNTKNIADNRKNIEDNRKNITNNTKNIADNSKKIENITKNIAGNSQLINNNTQNISNNTKNIEDNRKSIEDNRKNIAGNSQLINNNTQNISNNTKNIADNRKSIEDNRKNIAGNSQLINKNAQNISNNTKNIADNRKSIEDNRKNIAGNTQRINTNTQNIAKNAQDISNLTQNIAGNTQRISNLDNRLNKVGAGAAALAGLHPLDFDPDEKWDFAAGYGHYKGANAAAIGAFYRPNEDTMFSIAGTVGNGDEMISAGVSVKFGQANHVSVSRVAMAKEIIELRKELDDLRSFLADSVAGNVLDLSKIQLFPDTPENHWAYDYVGTLAGNGILEGYPDGYFKGNRQMTRYEMAAVLYRAMLRGVKLKEKALREFAPELDRIRVDTITKHKDGSPDIQRVRTIEGRGC